MAYRKESRADVPWHGLGEAIEHDSTPAEMLVAAGLDWTVSKRPLFTPHNTEPIDTLENYVKYGGKVLPVSDYFALVRDSDNKILGPAGKDYLPIQNAQAFDFFKKFTDAGHMRMETAGSLQGGTQVWVLAKLMWSFKLPGDDEVRGYLLMSSPHIWGKSFVMKFVTIRVVCMNTFVMAMNEASSSRGFRMPHIRAFDAEVQQEAAITLGIAKELFDGFEATSNKLAQTKVNTEVVIRYVADIFQPELLIDAFGKSYGKANEFEQARLIVAPDSPRLVPSQLKRTAYDVFNAVTRQPGATLESSVGTMWGAFNAVTYYTDHQAGRSRDNALYAAWFGPKAATKGLALKRAVQIAEVVNG